MTSKNKKKLEVRDLLIPAITALTVAIIGGVFGLISPILLEKYKSTISEKNTQDIQDYSPYISIDPQQMNFISGPIDGLYISNLDVVSNLYSWSAKVNNNWYPAETKSCLINKGFPPPQRRPLNLLVHSPTVSTSIYWEKPGEIILQGYTLIVDYRPLNAKIDEIQILLGGFGGEDDPILFKKELPAVDVASSNKKTYDQEIDWIHLREKMGVTLLIPINLGKPGTYSLQIKFNAVLSGDLQSTQSRYITLTTGELEYSWIDIDDPSKYPTNAGTSSVDLIPCP